MGAVSLTLLSVELPFRRCLFGAAFQWGCLFGVAFNGIAAALPQWSCLFDGTFFGAGLSQCQAVELPCLCCQELPFWHCLCGCLAGAAFLALPFCRCFSGAAFFALPSVELPSCLDGPKIRRGRIILTYVPTCHVRP